MRVCLTNKFLFRVFFLRSVQGRERQQNFAGRLPQRGQERSEDEAEK